MEIIKHIKKKDKGISILIIWKITSAESLNLIENNRKKIKAPYEK